MHAGLLLGSAEVARDASVVTGPATQMLTDRITTSAATLLAEIGDARGRFLTDDALPATADSHSRPEPRASGRARCLAIRRACNHRLRQALVDFAVDRRRRLPMGP